MASLAYDLIRDTMGIHLIRFIPMNQRPVLKFDDNTKEAENWIRGGAIIQKVIAKMLKDEKIPYSDDLGAELENLSGKADMYVKAYLAITPQLESSLDGLVISAKEQWAEDGGSDYCESSARWNRLPKCPVHDDEWDWDEVESLLY